MMISNKKVELLAPAGNFDSLKAAIQNGADAVYIGGSKFGARAFAVNFDAYELKNAVEYAHIRGVKIYVTVNTLISDDDFEEFAEYIEFLYLNDVDAVILQDIGMVNVVKKLFPDFELHASTQMSIANLQDALFYKSMGFTRIVLARENSFEEIKHIQKNTGLEIESFVHGALCVSYSGKCLFSYMNGGRSSNQGACAQPCRKKYSLDNKPDSFEYFLSTKDLCTVRELDKIIENGTYSLKIEGRMKRPEYVATVVRNYRRAIDSYFSKENIDLEKIEFEMQSIFNREFTKGLILDDFSKNIVNKKTPNNIGVRIGKVTRINTKQKKIELLLEEDLNKGDGLNLGEYVGRIFLDGKIVDSATKGQRVELDFIGKAKVGDVVRKTSDFSLIQRATESIESENRKISLKCKIVAKLGSFPEVIASDTDGNEVRYFESGEIVSSAISKPIVESDIIAQFSKTEDVPYKFVEFEFDIDESVFLKKSTLNSMRRNVIELFDTERRKVYPGRTKSLTEEFLPKTDFKISSISSITEEMLSIKCLTKSQIDLCKKIGVGSVYVDNFENYEYAVSIGVKVFFLTPYILKDYQISILDNFVEKHSPSILTTSLGYAKYLSERYDEKNISKQIRMDYMLNVYNHRTMQFLNDLNYINSFTVGLEYPFSNGFDSYKLNLEKIEIPLQIYPALMVTEYCPNKENYPCKMCLVDNKTLKPHDNSSKITIKRDMFCRMQLIDNKPYSNIGLIDGFKKSGIKRYRIDVFKETEQEILTLMKKILV